MPSLLYRLSCLCLIATLPALADTTVPGKREWLVRTWHPEGAAHNRLKGLTQTSDGFLWGVISDALLRFDGIHFEEFPRQNIAGLNDKFRAALGTRDGSLWVACDDGPVVQLRDGKATIFTNDLPRSMPHSPIEDGEGAIWIGYSQGTVCRIKDGHVYQWAKENGLPDGGRVVLAADRQGRVWFAKDGHVGLFRNGRFETLLRLDNIGARLAAAADGSIWIFSGTQLFKYREGAALVSHGSFEGINRSTRATVLLEDRSGVLWIGTQNGGMLCYRESRFESIPTSHPAINDLMEDREGSVWAAAGGDLNAIRPRAIRVETPETETPAKAVHSLCQDSEGMLWATTKDGSLMRHGTNGWEIAPLPIKLASCVASGPAGDLWVGTWNHSVYWFGNGQSRSWGRRDGVTSHSIRCILVSRTGDVWLAGESPSALYRVRDGTLKAIPLPPTIGRLRAMTEDSAGSLWIGGTTGTLLRVHDEKVVDESSRLEKSTLVRSLYAMDDGSVWLGCNGALGRLKDGRLTFVKTEHGLGGGHIFQMIAEGDWFWFGGAAGVFKVHRAELEGIIEGRLSRIQPVHYGPDEGTPLRAGLDDQSSAIRTDDGRLWIPMGTDMAIVNPAELRDYLEPPPLIIKKISVNDELFASHPNPIPGRSRVALGPDTVLRLPPDYRRLEFEFAALSFRTLNNVRLRYQVEGFDGRWVEAELRRTATYPRLPPGNYRFRVKACSGDGIWNEAAVAFTVSRTFWQSGWFHASALAGFTVLMGTMVRYASLRRLRGKLRKLQQESALEQERSRIARDLHDDLGSRLTRIVLLNELALHNRLPREAAAGHAQQISTALRQGIQALDEVVWAINPRNDVLPQVLNYIGQFAMDFLKAARIPCRLDLPPHPPSRLVSAEARHHLLSVAKEALNNAVLHGHPTEVWLRAAFREDALILVIEDNGCGFRPMPAAAGGDGLQNMRQRMEEIGGQFAIESTPGNGTRVTFSVPLAR